MLKPKPRFVITQAPSPQSVFWLIDTKNGKALELPLCDLRSAERMVEFLDETVPSPYEPKPVDEPVDYNPVVIQRQNLIIGLLEEMLQLLVCGDYRNHPNYHKIREHRREVSKLQTKHVYSLKD